MLLHLFRWVQLPSFQSIAYILNLLSHARPCLADGDNLITTEVENTVDYNIITLYFNTTNVPSWNCNIMKNYCKSMKNFLFVKNDRLYHHTHEHMLLTKSTLQSSTKSKGIEFHNKVMARVYMHNFLTRYSISYVKFCETKVNQGQ